MAKPKPDTKADAPGESGSITPRAEPLSLRHLPVELLDTIATFLDQASLRSLALTCKMSKPSALRVLYASYINRNAPSKAPFHTFLRTLCESPELAAMVKELDIRGWRSEFETATGLPWAGLTDTTGDQMRSSRAGPLFVSISKSVMRISKPLRLFEETAVRLGLVPRPLSSLVPALKKNARAGTSLNKDEDFVRLLRNDVEDAQIVLMLALLPNLQVLRIDGMSTHPTLDWYHFLKRAKSAPRSLRALFLYGNLPFDGKICHSTILAFLKLTPALETLSLLYINLKATSQPHDILSDKRLRRFYVEESKIDPRTLEAILSGQRLTKFWYNPTHEDLSAVEAVQLSEDRIVDYLSSSLHSLREIILYTTRTSQSPQLSKCNKLEVLQIPFQHGFLTGDPSDRQSITTALRKRISCSLATLVFRSVHPCMEVIICMEMLATLKRQGEFPALNTVSLNFCQEHMTPWLPPVPYGDLKASAMEQFGGILGEAGLKLQLAQTD